MPFVLKKIKAIKDKKIDIFILNKMGYSMKKTQRLLDRGRVFDDKYIKMDKSQTIYSDYIYLAIFEGITRGLKPILDTVDFAIFDKPSGVVVHPTSKYTEYCLLDEVHHYYGDDGNIVHRIDAETSGLVLVSKNKSSEVELKVMFEKRLYKKRYTAIVEGELKKEHTIDTPISKDVDSSIGVKMKTCINGKESLTIVKPIKYNHILDQTLVDVEIFTGRQHQIRVHLHSIDHKIVGDPIYGVDEDISEDYLNKTLSKDDRVKHTRADRLMLHSNYIEFKYNKNFYKIYSKQKNFYDII